MLCTPITSFLADRPHRLYLRLPGILNDPFCCNMLLATEWYLLHQTRQWHYFAFYIPPKLPLPLWGSAPPSNTWYLRPTRVIIPNGISIASAVSVWVPNALLYNALSVGKTPKLLLLLGISSPCQRRTEQRSYATCIEKLVKIARVVQEISSQTDRHITRQTRSSQYFATAPTGEVITITSLLNASNLLRNQNNTDHCYKRRQLKPQQAHHLSARRLGNTRHAG